ncbi:MAG: hypothetical protein IGS48_10810 [Oscillatoriales cyanobacterium C42_A2020_001]|nr:hypothetical protein [Leptolyngbyaceae cyanobacterium C42_A2020_001]
MLIRKVSRPDISFLRENTDGVRQVAQNIAVATCMATASQKASPDSAIARFIVLQAF